MAIVMVIVMANRSLCASSSTAQWYADSGHLPNAIVTKLCSFYVCVCVCDCVGVVGKANGLGFHPHAKRGPTFFQHVSFVLYVCVCECVCVSLWCVRACVGAVPKRFYCSTQRRVAASSLVLTTCCCESCCVPSSVLRARNASLD